MIAYDNPVAYLVRTINVSLKPAFWYAFASYSFMLPSVLEKLASLVLTINASSCTFGCCCIVILLYCADCLLCFC